MITAKNNGKQIGQKKGARFEIVENYLRLGKITEAKDYLLSFKDWLYSDDLRARFYRRLGYIYAETKSYEIAYACLMKSLELKKTPEALSEM